jgi:hypothetical protein
MDSVLAIASEYGIRIIISFLEGPPWWGAKRTFARLRNGDFRFESDSVKNDYRHLVRYICNRRNSVTGIQYKNDRQFSAGKPAMKCTLPVNAQGDGRIHQIGRF